jgi:hypothetical protein|nr:MAG TPA: hypothetical protein [Caudoviricetes sp.]
MDNEVIKPEIIVEVSYYHEKFNNMFFNVDRCETGAGFLSIGHCVPNKNEEGKTLYVITNIDLKRIKEFKMFRSLEDFNASYGIYPKPTWANDGDIVPEWGVGKKYEIEIEYLDKDNRPEKVNIINVTNASYIQEAGLDMLKFEYLLKDGHASHYGIGLSKLVKWKVIREME